MLFMTQLEMLVGAIGKGKMRAREKMGIESSD
jgi:hypothetical protein